MTVEQTNGPLTGVRVLVLAGMGPTPFASMLLADMGAQVVRITRPVSQPGRVVSQVESMRPEHDIANRGVDTIALDLKSKAGRNAVLELVDHADVFVEGFRPGVTERLGLGPEVLLSRNPPLVYARLTGYGQTGPLSLDAGHDINYVAQSGVLHALRRQGEAPHPPMNLLGDYAGGGTFAALGIVCALLASRTSGEGQVVDAAMIDGVALLSARIQGLRAAGVWTDEPGTNHLDTGAPFYDTYRCADGKYLAVGALEPDFYREFVKGLGIDVSDWPDQHDTAQWPLLRQLISDAIAARTRDAWSQVYQGTDSCVTPVLDFEEAATAAHNVTRGLFRKIGGVLHPAPTPRFSRTPARPVGVPAADEVDFHRVVCEWQIVGDPGVAHTIGKDGS
ncbi:MULTISPECIES: CaiB/BaiF CoA-transferase family protein [unclassified Pseudofrankia]|uniref:CaiB/BaiF CoA transferase family protein n=1 Tax=unclassified Pseudofrankia TaxID=2994372 RepID=UPI0008D99972|nr:MULTISPECIES: CaiB/BaiF CoA-transferase family protein [unclassified Pseudofrankia]MDT3444910.1 CaiB/BaiF CoA-transferase family protein [Pseudofrankia sp. BMG5.37]OHV64819.1 carnitine dehydratase [Pseudofrankia sp. BMG5.36]